MKNRNKPQTYGSNTKVAKKEPNIIFYIILMVIFIGTTVLLSRITASDAVITIAEQDIPVRTLSGVLSSIANVCLIFMVVFYRKLGFYTALIVLGTQFPIMFIRIFIHGNVAAISGLFTNLVTLIAIILIYRRNSKIEEYQIYELEYIIRQQKHSDRLFELDAEIINIRVT